MVIPTKLQNVNNFNNLVFNFETGGTNSSSRKPGSLKFWRMKKNQSFKVSLSAALENIGIISDFKTATMQNPREPPKVNLRYGKLKLNKNIHCQNV